MWLVAVYHQVSMFSLKPSDATSTGGRSLLIPTPFSIKMALTDVALRSWGMIEGEALFPSIIDLKIALSPPPHIVVNNSFVRIHKPRREKGSQADADIDETTDNGSTLQGGPYIRSVAFREYVQYGGPLGLAIEVESQDQVDRFSHLLMQINYFGKRGSLFQIDSPPRVAKHPSAQEGYFRLDTEIPTSSELLPGTILQVIDDCTPKLTFEQANIYSGKKITSKERVQRTIALPYKLARSSRGFSFYVRQ